MKEKNNLPNRWRESIKLFNAYPHNIKDHSYLNAILI